MPAYSIRRGPELPANPISGKVFIKNAGASQGLYVCTVAGTWVGPFSTGGGSGITNDAPVGGIPTTGDVDGNLIAQDDVPLVDPGNVWAASTAVAQGHRFAETVEGALRVFEVTVAGTTGPGVFSDYEPFDLAPSGEWGTGTEVFIYLGIVGQVSWGVAPVLVPRLTLGAHDGGSAGGRALRYKSDAPPGESSNLFAVQATVSGVAVSIFEMKTDGDGDYALDENTGAGLRFNRCADGAIVSPAQYVQITYEGLQVVADSVAFQVLFGNPLRVVMTGLPTTNPAAAGQLWNDAGTLKISAG